MNTIRLTKEFGFEAAHALWGYDGKCKNIHGHSYKLSVTIIGQIKEQKGNPKDGMLIDFGDLKKIVYENIINKYDHAVVVSKNAPTEQISSIPEMFDSTIISNYQPTCENMLIDFAELISSKLPSNVKLHSLKLHETANSYGEWYAEDNLKNN